MSYTVSGRLASDGSTSPGMMGCCSGDPLTVEILNIHAEVLESRAVGGPTGPWTEHRHLANPLSALWLMRELLGDDITAEGGVARAPADSRWRGPMILADAAKRWIQCSRDVTASQTAIFVAEGKIRREQEDSAMTDEQMENLTRDPLDFFNDLSACCHIEAEQTGEDQAEDERNDESPGPRTSGQKPQH